MVSLESKDALLQLVRLGIGTSKDAKISKDIDWEPVEALAERQGLLGVVYDGVLRHTEITESTEILPLMVKLRWMGKVMQGYEQRYALYRKTVADLAAWYHAHGYRMMVLKGLACGENWPKPEHRPYGDIDIFLFGKQSEADALMVQEFKVVGRADGIPQGFKVDRSHHHHTLFQWQGFTVENHYDFVNIHHHKSNVELEKLFKELSVDDSNSIDLGGVQAYLPSANLNALFLIKHLVSHFASDKITLRQLLDWAFFVDKHHVEIDWNWLVEVLRKYHMKEFFDCVNAISVEDLGFDKVESLELRVESQLKSLEFKKLKERIFSDTLTPEFEEETPKKVWKRMPFKYRRWKANRWKRELCYEDGQLRTFLGGVWNHLLKPAGI